MFFGSAALGTLTGLISALVSRFLQPCVCVHVCFCPIYSLTHRLVSKTLWPEEDPFTGVRHDDNLCIPPLWPGRRHQTVWWVRTSTSTFTFVFHFMRLLIIHFSLSTWRNNVHPVCGNCDVTLHPSQFVTRHTDPHATDTAHSCFHVWYVKSFSLPYKYHFVFKFWF